MNSVIEHELANMSIEEKIILVEDLWDSIASTENEIQLTSAQKKELDRRFEHYQNNPETAVLWENMKAKLTEKSEYVSHNP